MDKETEEFAAKVLLSIQQAKRGEFARVHTPQDIATYKARGRPVGTTKPDAKQAVKLRLDPDVLAALRATGRGWQTRVNDAMREWVKTHPAA